MSLATKQQRVKKVDILKEDKEIPNQKFFLSQFVSPDEIIKKKEIYFFEAFAKLWDITKSTTKFNDFMHFISAKYNIKVELLSADFEQFLSDEEVKGEVMDYSLGVYDDYKTFIEQNEERLTAEFDAKHEFQTSVRGLKIKGVYATEEEANTMAKLFREEEKEHDIFIGYVGKWLPLDITAYKTGNVNYLEEDLNNLMHEKQKNEKLAKSQFTDRVNEAKKKAIEENVRKAQSAGNITLTQAINPDGQLVDARTLAKHEPALVQQLEVTESEIIDKLFGGEDIVMPK